MIECFQGRIITIPSNRFIQGKSFLLYALGNIYSSIDCIYLNENNVE